MSKNSIENLENEPHDIFVQELRNELDHITETDWEKIFIRFDCVNNFSEVNIFPSAPDGKLLRVRRSDKLIDLFFTLRKQDYDTTGAAWYSLVIEIDKVKDEINYIYNYEDEPKWQLPELPHEQKEYILNREYSAELDNYPRETTPTPGWLINRAMNWNPLETVEAEQGTYSGLPEFDEAPAHIGHNHPKAEAVINTLIGLCLHVQPPKEVYGDWSTIKLRARSVGDLFEWDIFGYDMNNETIPIAYQELSPTFDEVLKLLRLATYSSQTGAWFSAEITLENESQGINIHFDYDAEPLWTFPRNENGDLPQTFYDAYQTELEYFPRPINRIPAWLENRL